MMWMKSLNDFGNALIYTENEREKIKTETKGKEVERGWRKKSIVRESPLNPPKRPF